MSTLRTENISDGTNSTSTTNVVKGSAKAWVNFNGTGTVAIREAYNVGSITDNGTGNYTANFTTAMPDANYCVSATGINQTTLCPNAFATTSVTVVLRNISGVNLDLDYNSVAIFR